MVVTQHPASEHDQLAFADLVLRRLASECPGALVDMVRAVDYEARVLLRQPVRLPAGSAFEIAGSRVLTLPRTRRALRLAASARSGPLPAIVPFVSSASGRSVTVAAAGSGAAGSPVSATVADRAMQLHWLAPWGRGEVESVATWPGSGCQRAMPRAREAPGSAPAASAAVTSADPETDRPPVGYLVFAGESEAIDCDHPRWGGARVGVVRSALAQHPVPPHGGPTGRWSPLRVGDTEYVLVDQCP